MKLCADCNTEKPLERFNKHNPYYCQDCLNRRNKEWRQRKRREYLEANPPKPKEIAADKLCKRCGTIKPISEFYTLKGRWSYYFCKSCSSEVGALRRKVGGREYEQLRYKCNKVGAKPEWFLAQMEEQGGKCAICGNPEIHRHKKGSDKIRSLAIDHDHGTGTIRGLLCFRCNTALYQLEKNGREWAHKAVSYLDKYQET